MPLFRLENRNHIIIMLMLSLSIVFLAPTNAVFAQDTTWTQILPAWVDDVYYTNFFLGGNYYTKVSLVDIDADGDLDLLYGGGNTGTFVYFENVGSAQSASFQLRYEEFPGLGVVGMSDGSYDVDFADLDGDGDLDAGLAANLDGSGGVIFWNDGTPSRATFVYRRPYGPMNMGGNPTLVDIDADGDYDFFGGAGYRGFQLEFSENVGSDTMPLFAATDYHYQGLFLGIPFCFDMGDLDRDGDFDMISCREGGAVYYWENTGTPESPAFVLADSNYLAFRDTTDWLESPELADIDADGDLDLFLAGGYAHLYFFENIGTPQMAEFVQRYDTTFFYNFRGYHGSLLSGAGDIDDDGDLDLVVGIGLLINESSGGQFRFRRQDNIMPPYLGTLVDLDADGDLDYVCAGPPNTPGYFENIGTPAQPSWAEGGDLFPSDGHLTNLFEVALADLDADGDKDLYVAHAAGHHFAFYRNDGSPQDYDFTYAGEIFVPGYELHDYTGIYFADLDHDWDYDLLAADVVANDSYDETSRLAFIRNDGTPYSPSWTFVTSDYGGLISGHRQGGVTACPVDIDGDRDLDLFLSASMGLQLYLNPLDPDAIEEDIPTPIAGDLSLSCYPNPFNSLTTISIDNSDNTKISIFDITGRLVATLKAEKGRAVWDATGFTSGIYFARVREGKKAQSIRLVLLK